MRPIAIPSAACSRFIETVESSADSASTLGVDSGGIGFLRQGPFFVVRLGVLLLAVFARATPLWRGEGEGGGKILKSQSENPAEKIAS